METLKNTSERIYLMQYIKCNVKAKAVLHDVIVQGVSQLTLQEFQPIFGILGGDSSDKIMLHQNEQINFMRFIAILDASLVVTGCHRGNADSSPA